MKETELKQYREQLLNEVYNEAERQGDNGAINLYLLWKIIQAHKR